MNNSFHPSTYEIIFFNKFCLFKLATLAPLTKESTREISLNFLDGWWRVCLIFNVILLNAWIHVTWSIFKQNKTWSGTKLIIYYQGRTQKKDRGWACPPPPNTILGRATPPSRLLVLKEFERENHRNRKIFFYLQINGAN